MLSKTHKLTEEITAALGPIFQKHPDYSIIQQAMGLVLGRIAQATPDAGAETLSLEVIHEYAKKALEEFLKLEARQLAKESLVSKGIDGFAELARSREPVEPGGPADYPDNSDKPVAKTQKPWPPVQDQAEEEIGPFGGKLADGAECPEFGYVVPLEEDETKEG